MSRRELSGYVHWPATPQACNDSVVLCLPIHRMVGQHFISHHKKAMLMWCMYSLRLVHLSTKVIR